MAKYVFALRNCRSKNSGKALGDASNHASAKSLKYIHHSGSINAAAKKELMEELKAAGRLNDPDSKLQKLISSVAAAKDEIKSSTATYSERVGKAVVQIGVGYHESDFGEAKSGIVWLDLD